uniref:BTB/POZ domain-containing protein n=1 Tax=Globodera rostochiensis TaxID=31243 RepID=A0A914HPC1_GLORO
MQQKHHHSNVIVGMNHAQQNIVPKANSSLERMKHLLVTGDRADVYFLVGEGDEKELLPAHKAILEKASDVFEAMFRFDEENAKAAAAETAPPAEEIKPVVITDVKVDAFKAMLAFIYADDLSGLNGNNAISVLQAANKYNLPGLVKACVAFPTPELRNVFVALAEARFLGEKNYLNYQFLLFWDFARRCLDYIDENAATLIPSKAFLQIDQQLLCEILDRDQLRVSEIAIWNAALGWADEKCRQNGEECSAENRLKMLGPAFFKIRFPLIPQKDFIDNIVSCGLLTSDELDSILQHYVHPNSVLLERYPLQFPTKQRSMPVKGTILLKIEKVSEFAREDGTKRRYSEPIYIRGLPWKIVTYSTVSEQKYLAFFLQCNGENTDANWSCAVSATLRIVSQKEGKTDHTRGSKRLIYNSKKKSWGLSLFISFEKLMDRNNGLYDEENDTVILEVEMTAEEPEVPLLSKIWRRFGKGQQQ